MAKSPAGKKPKDVALLQGPTEDGEGARIVRFRDGVVSAGEVRPVKEGQSLNQQELLRLTPLKGAPALCEVEVLHEPAPSKGKSGPAQVATDTYRRNWSQIFEQSEGERVSSQGEPQASAGDSRRRSPKAKPRTAGKHDWTLN